MTKPIIQTKPRKGFCVPTNQAAMMAPVHAPMRGKKKPRVNRVPKVQAAMSDERLDLTS